MVLWRTTRRTEWCKRTQKYFSSPSSKPPQCMDFSKHTTGRSNQAAALNHTGQRRWQAGSSAQPTMVTGDYTSCVEQCSSSLPLLLPCVPVQPRLSKRNSEQQFAALSHKGSGIICGARVKFKGSEQPQCLVHCRAQPQQKHSPRSF